MSLYATATNATTAGGPPKAANQGILQGENPSVYNAADPITLFIIQVSSYAV